MLYTFDANLLLVRNGETLKVDTHLVFKDAELYIKLAEGCNFSCAGCATSSDLIHPSKAITLDLDTVKLFLDSFLKSCAEKKFAEANIKWAGGEPLLNHSYPILREGVLYLKKLSEKYKNIKINQTVLTNGVFLTQAKAQFLKENNIHISVSLWGTREFQDVMRRPRNKTESFPVIIDNIKTLIELNCSFNVNYVITSQNACDFESFITLMWDTGGVFTKPIPLGIAFYRPQSNISRKYLKQSYKLIEQGLKKGFAKIYEFIDRGIAIQPLFKIDYLNLFNTILTPCGTGFNYVAVGPLGAASCHEGLFSMKKNLDQIKAGKNIIDLANKEYKSRTRLLLSTKELPMALALHGGAGCPRLAREENTGKLGKPTSTAYLYKAIYKDILALEATRQLKLNTFQLVDQHSHQAAQVNQ